MIDIEKMKRAALAARDAPLHDDTVFLDYLATCNANAVLELIARLEAAEKDAARGKVFVAEAERDYVEVSTGEDPYYQRFECAAAMEEFADEAMKESK